MRHLGGVSRDSWPEWARPQLQAAVELAARTAPGRMLATQLYEGWFAGAVPAGVPATAALAGTYRRAHAGAATSIVDGLPVVDLQDRIGADGWWRTWNTRWRPRVGDTRLLLSPQRADTIVALLTARLRDVPYLLACPTDPVQLRRSGSVVLYVARASVVDAAFVAELAPALRADTPPLCLPIAPGVAAAQYPDNGMTFGEHRCNLLALALADGPPQALTVIADVFAAHGVDPSTPHLSGVVSRAG